MKLIKNEIEKISLSYFDSIIDDYDYLKNTGEHYRLLTYISKQFDNEVIIDAGTCQGHSCLAFAQNSNNKVYTYDIEPKDITHITDNYSNVIKNILDINLVDDSLLSSAKIILLDIDPHNGNIEIDFYDKLISVNFTGFLICDDIYLNDDIKIFLNYLYK